MIEIFVVSSILVLSLFIHVVMREDDITDRTSYISSIISSFRHTVVVSGCVKCRACRDSSILLYCNQL